MTIKEAFDRYQNTINVDDRINAWYTYLDCRDNKPIGYYKAKQEEFRKNRYKIVLPDNTPSLSNS